MAKRQFLEDAPKAPYLVGYARVSTDEQKLDLQLHALRKAGVRPEDIYVEKVSGASKRRPELALCIKALRPGDTLVVWRLDRIARNVREFYEHIDQISRREAGFRSLTEHFDFTTAGGKLILGVFALMADFERQLTVERTKAGVAAWKERGGQPGRKVTFTKAKQDRAKAMLKRGATLRAVATKFGISTSLLHQRGLRRVWK